jgi:hypothetical protein
MDGQGAEGAKLSGIPELNTVPRPATRAMESATRRDLRPGGKAQATFSTRAGLKSKA